MSAGRGLILAAPNSGSGKTTVTLGLLSALSRAGVAVRGAKSGPDYIDPAYHEAACGQPSVNLDGWAMTPERLRALAAGDGLLLIEGAMGLFDGAGLSGQGSSAGLATVLDLPVVLIVDCARMSQSIAALVQGYAQLDPKVRVAGLILNRVGSDRHERMLRTALEPVGIEVLGALRRADALTLPSRHLGLVQAGEHRDIAGFMERAAGLMAAQIDLAALQAVADLLPEASPVTPPCPYRRIAVARDAAFTFCYPHQMADWRAAGTEVIPFSPLANDAVPEADMIFLPGGYPELHAGQISGAERFIESLKYRAQDTVIYGECGGYMVLGETLTDADGVPHKMAGLLGLKTSFAERRRHLGYRRLTSLSEHMPGRFAAHEFHYATTLSAHGTPLFEAEDADGAALPPMGLQEGRVIGSFAHIIDPL